MGQGMTKQQKQICAGQFAATDPTQSIHKAIDRNSLGAKAVTSASHFRHPSAVTIPVQSAESSTGHTFSSISAQKFENYSGSQSQRLMVPSNHGSRDSSC